MHQAQVSQKKQWFWHIFESKTSVFLPIVISTSVLRIFVCLYFAFLWHCSQNLFKILHTVKSCLEESEGTQVWEKKHLLATKWVILTLIWTQKHVCFVLRFYSKDFMNTNNKIRALQVGKNENNQYLEKYSY